VHDIPIDAISRHFSAAIEKSQDLARPEVQRRQTQLLEKLCRHARQHVPFYRDTKRLDPLFRQDGSFSRDGWDDVPILTRGEAVDNEVALTAEKVPSEMLPVADDRTSGSTGTPFRIKRSFMQAISSHVLFERAAKWNKCGPITKLAITDVVPVEARDHHADGAQEVNESSSVIVPAHLDPLKQIEIIARYKPSHIIAFPNLVQAWMETGNFGALASLRTMFSTGEVLRPEIRDMLERQLKVRVINFYSATETGPIAVAGPDGRLRISEEALLLEQPDGPVDPSRPVLVTATPFYAYAMPLIRYATGDYVRFSSRRPRESVGLRRLEAVLGRERNLFRRRDGARIWPAVHGDVIGDIIPLRGWQLVQETIDQLVMKIVTPAAPDAEALAKCREALEKMVPGFDIRLEVVDRIDDDRANGKRFESCLSLLA
jgi:phenylacetate-CoA ligase